MSQLVMDMTPESLGNLIAGLRHEPGKVRRIWERRCETRRCHWIGLYEINGSHVVWASAFKMSPAAATDQNNGEQHVPDRAWLADRAPADQLFGCRHTIRRTE